MTDTKLSALEEKLKQANSYQEWLLLAQQKDVHTGVDRWRDETPESGIYGILTEHVMTINQMLNEQRWIDLADFLKESLYRNTSELNDHRLYKTALSGPKRIVEDYLNTVTKALDQLCHTEIDGLSRQDKLTLFQHAERNFGRPSLMLSGGGTFGIYHMGVIQALLEQDLLPEVISGTSMGSIAAGIMAINNNESLRALYNKPEDRHYHPLKRLSVKDMWSSKSMLSETQLKECVESNIGDITFAEAYAKTGREISITVSSVRSGQKPRILNHLTAPNVLISSASKASCSVPGLFPPCKLQAKTVTGEIVDYMPTEYWVDGSFASDIPQKRIGRLHNVNYFIVSQANPHVLPFVSHRHKSGVLATVKDIAVSSVVNQGRTLLKVAKRRLHKEPWRSWLDHGALVLGQEYLGDINLHPDFPAEWYLKFMKNPTVEEIHFLLKTGERATWPYLKMIDHQTLISRKLRKCVEACS